MSRTKKRRQRKKLQLRPPNLDGTPEIVELKKWMSSKGWHNETRLQLRDFEATGRGVCSKQLVNPRKVLIEVPYDLMISWTTLQRSELGCAAEGLKMQDMLALFLALELHKGGRSEWVEYLGSLPKEVPGLPWLCDCYSEGRGGANLFVEAGQDTSTNILKFEQPFPLEAEHRTSVLKFEVGATQAQEYSGEARTTSVQSKNLVDHQRMSCKCPDFLKMTALSSDFESSCRRVRKSIRHTKCLCCGVGLDCVITENSYTWGYTMVNTRSVYVDPKIVRSTTPGLCNLVDEPSMALCPYLDMFNHSHLATTDAQLVYIGDKWVYQLKSPQPYKQYQQIYISYGPHDNTKLLLEYGFFIPGNTFDSIAFSFDVVVRHLSKQGLQLSPRQYKYLKSKSLDRNLHVSTVALSFNLKALYHVSFADSGNWNALIYADGYSEDDLIRMLSLTRSLLLDEHPAICEGPHCPSLVAYLDYQTEYRRAVLRYLEDEISIDRNRFA